MSAAVMGKDRDAMAANTCGHGRSPAEGYGNWPQPGCATNLPRTSIASPWHAPAEREWARLIRQGTG